MKNSWYLIISLDNTGKITKDRAKIVSEQHIQICTCGKKIIKKQSPLSTYQNGYGSPKCQYCGNDNFIFCTMYQHFHKSLYELFNPFKYDDLQFNYTQGIIDNTYHTYANLILPMVDFSSNKAVFKREKIIGISINPNGEVQKNIYNELPWGIDNFYTPTTKHYSATNSQSNKNNIFQILEKKLIKYIINKPFKKLKTVAIFLTNEYRKIQTLNELKFFIQYPNIDTIEILRWDLFEEVEKALKNYESLTNLLHYVINHRKEKSIKKALFVKYEKHIQHYAIYNPRVDFILSRTIDNTDLLAKAIGSDSEKMGDFKWQNVSDVIWLIIFLKKFYKEKSIISLFKKNDLVFDYWKDIINMVSQNKEAIKKYFKKVKCDVKSLHDEISRSIKSELIKKTFQTFSYKKNIFDTQTHIDNFTFKLPKNSYELFEWSEVLNNCIFSYENSIAKSHSIIYGVFIDSELKYALEVVKHTLLQASGHNNTQIPKHHMKTIDLWLEKNKMDKIL